MDDLDLSNCVTKPIGKSQYSLFALNIHIGETIQAGHYTTICKNYSDNMWRHYNDNIVKVQAVNAKIDDKYLWNMAHPGYAYTLYYQLNSLYSTIDINNCKFLIVNIIDLMLFNIINIIVSESFSRFSFHNQSIELMEVNETIQNSIFATIEKGFSLKIENFEIQVIQKDMFHANANVAIIPAGPILSKQKHLNETEIIQTNNHMSNCKFICHAAFPVSNNYNRKEKLFFKILQQTYYNSMIYAQNKLEAAK